MKNKPPKKPDYQQNPSFKEGHERVHRDVLTAVSHELKTPLASIIGSLEIYNRANEKLTVDKRKILIDTALQEAYRLDSIITDILDLAKLESGTVNVRKELCVMDLLIEDCLILLGRHLRECDITVNALPATFAVTTDPLLLVRAIRIVLDNAAKYGGPNPVIGVEYEKVGKLVVVHVQNNGPGIPESKLDNLFSKDAQFTIQDIEHPGMGLGLPICREIMRLLEGTVTVDNLANGKGAVFTLAFAA
jgi:two-component system sensor histidine kinase KdpD